MAESKSMIGKKFGMATVLRQTTSRDGHARYICECDCGKKFIATGSRLRGGLTTSCGCQKGKKVSAARKKQVPFAWSRTRLYGIWHDMKRRCNNPSYHHYQAYGGRGITYCAEWETFEPFKEWAVANGYKADLTIDRIDVDGNYSPDNCRFVSRKVQANNTRSNHYISYNGETLSAADWCRRLGLNYRKTLRQIKAGVPPEEVFLSKEVKETPDSDDAAEICSNL